MPCDHGISRSDATVPLLDQLAPEIVRNGSGKMIVDDVVDLPEGEHADVPQVRFIEQAAPEPRESSAPRRPIDGREPTPEGPRRPEGKRRAPAGRRPRALPDPQTVHDVRAPGVLT